MTLLIVMQRVNAAESAGLCGTDAALKPRSARYREDCELALPSRLVARHKIVYRLSERRRLHRIEKTTLLLASTLYSRRKVAMRGTSSRVALKEFLWGQVPGVSE